MSSTKKMTKTFACETILPHNEAELCRLLGASTNISSNAALFFVLMVASGVIDKRTKLDTGVFSVRPILWGLHVAPSGTKKTPIYNHLTETLNEIEIEYSKKTEQAFKDYEKKKIVFMKLVEKKGKNEELPELPEIPPELSLVISDATPESVASAANHNPRGIILACDEIGSALSKIESKQGDLTRSMWLQAYNGDMYTVQRKTSRKMVIPEFSLSVIGGIQPSALTRSVDAERGDGLLSRFLCCYIEWDIDESRKGKDFSFKKEKQSYNKTIRKIFEQEAKTVSLSTSAKERFYEISSKNDRYSEKMSRDESHWSGFLKKRSGFIARLTLVLHALYCVSKGEPLADVVPESTLENAVNLFDNFFVAQAKTVYREVGFPLGDDDTEIILLREERAILEVIYETCKEKLAKDPAFDWTIDEIVCNRTSHFRDKEKRFARMCKLEATGSIMSQKQGRRNVVIVNRYNIEKALGKGDAQ